MAAIATALAVSVAWPALAVEIDPANPPPWPVGRMASDDIPSRFDRAPVADLLAARDAGEREAATVLSRRLRANDPALLAWARAGAARNDLRAMTMLAQMLSRTDRPEAIRLYRAAAELGDTGAMRSLASAYLAGDGVEKSETEAVRLYTAAADRGDETAVVSLLNYYGAGTAAPRDPEAAARWEAVRRARGIEIVVAVGPPAVLRPEPSPRTPVDKAPLLKAARAGDVAAMRKLAVAYEEDYGDRKAPAEALRWNKAAAEKGDVSAMAALAWAYRVGRGAPMDKEKGAEWLLKAARAGDRLAMLNLSGLYQRGDGVKADADQARYWRYQWFWSPELE